MAAPNAGEVVKLRAFSTGREALPPKICVHPPRDLRTRRCAGGGIRGVINNIGGSRCLLITVTVQKTSTRLVVRKSVDDTHGIACSLCDS